MYGREYSYRVLQLLTFPSDDAVSNSAFRSGSSATFAAPSFSTLAGVFSGADAIILFFSHFCRDLNI